MTDKIMTLHPKGKTGVNIDCRKYEKIKFAIIKSFPAGSELTFKDLNTKVIKRLRDSFDGSIPWYVETVKLDLEARGIIERLPGKSPQILRIRRPD